MQLQQTNQILIFFSCSYYTDSSLVNKELNKQKEMINSDEYIEKVAREKLGMVKKGERVFVDVGE